MPFNLFAKKNLLDLIINKQDIVLQEEPFRHVVVDKFFTQEYYFKLEEQFFKVFGRGLSEKDSKEKLSRFGAYDAYGFTPDPNEKSAINRLRTKEWKVFWENIFGQTYNNNEIMSFHHHEVDSKDGWPHSDFCPGSFVTERPSEKRLNSWYYNCKYEDKKQGRQPGTELSVRALTFIFYLANDPDGVGGDTALLDENKEIVKRVAPVKNRMLVFEVSPISFHTFLNNKTHVRNSLTQWFHVDYEQVKNNNNEDKLVGWK